MKPWPKIQQRPATVQREFRGVNKLDAFLIPNNQATATKNRTINDAGEHTTRPGYTVIGTFETGILGMAAHKDQELHFIANDGKWYRLNGDGTTSVLATSLNATAEWSLCNFKGNLSDIALIGANGVDTPRYYLTGGTSLTNLAGVPAGAKYLTQYADRLWAITNGTELHASAYRIADDWAGPVDPNDEDASGWYTVIESADGETVNGLISGMTRLIVTKPSSEYKLMGYAPSDYEVRPITYTTGQFNYKSGVTLDGWLYQLYDTGFYRYAGGSEPERDFSERIKDFINRINATGKAKSVIGTDGSKIYASIAVNSSTPDTMIVFDPKKDTYFLWEGIAATHFAQVGNDFYISDASGRILKLGGTTDGGTAITSNWVSKPFTAPSMAQTVRWLRMWVTLDLPVGSSLSVYLSKSPTGDSDWESIGTITPSASLQQYPLYVQSSKVANAKVIRFKIEGSGPFTIHEVAYESDTLPLR